MNRSRFKRELPLYAMLVIPAMIVILYSYLPMLGLVMAFQEFIPSSHGFLYSILHSKFVGWGVFRTLFTMEDTNRVIYNTFFIATLKIISKLLFPLIFALLLNEVLSGWFRKTVSTITYLPFFLSWVVLGGILLDFFSPQDGAFNHFLHLIHISPTFFFGTASQFPYAIVITDLWKEIGFNTIIFLAALTAIDPSMYESAIMDGAGRWKQMLYITLPSITSILILVGILSLGNILNAGQDQLLTLYSPVVYSSGDIIDTFAYRQGIKEGQFNIATAVGLFKSVISFVMISCSYLLANKYSDYRVF
ncbi:sugar ABC transporter permease [Paenibacillus marchantiophytorum]|uniref:Sugar ABC transporter permease n=1 Tax=Paenibacillus marchantiophytorum TaxID=1619310 RepID=A0ABQ2BSJ5_9BACL|nr:ABC transporter permease subunit [Paenibacillus marchantiophytorum]GGI46567.1 sugar ABC transporter permease [Paenibacillus marchantiophytorum]